MQMILNIFFWLKALKAISTGQDLDAFHYLNKIRTEKLPKAIEVLLLKAFTTLILKQNEQSIYYIEQAIALIDTVQIKKLNIDEKNYLKIYAYEVLQMNYQQIGQHDNSIQIQKKTIEISLDKSNVKKIYYRHFPIKSR